MTKATNMTRKQFERVPHRKKFDQEIECTALVVMPSEVKFFDEIKFALVLLAYKIAPRVLRKYDKWELVSGLHDSGYRCMDFVAINKDDEPICKLSGCSDVIHIEGIGGYGYKWLEKYDGVPKKIDPFGWNIDCLPKSGLLRLFNRETIVCGAGLSSFEIYSKPRK